jgi:hypothetical protein
MHMTETRLLVQCHTILSRRKRVAGRAVGRTEILRGRIENGQRALRIFRGWRIGGSYRTHQVQFQIFWFNMLMNI